jgi:deazaflavin-dependent oxidoreductase (nitroreductase family)
MPLPRWLAQVNRKVFNPGAIKRGSWPVLVHTGRVSGRTYRTPLDTYAVDDGYLFTVNYGTRSDWPKNVVAAGEARLELDGQTIELGDPRILPVDEAYQLMAPNAKKPPSFVGVEQCLVTTVVRVDADR